jgi:protein-disulfide isomerase
MKIRRSALLVATCLAGLWTSAFGAADGAQLKLPDGVDLAIVVFEDLQCPDCRRAHPDLVKAAEANGVPLIVHDYPIPRHSWAFPAAVLARYFSAQSQALGMDFRSFIFQNQPGLGPDNLRAFGEKFAANHEQQLPGDVDPDGRLAAQVQADFELGQKIHLEYVPLMFVIARSGDASRAIEAKEPKDVNAIIDRIRRGESPSQP